MTSIEAKKIISHAMELAFGFSPARSQITVKHCSDFEDNVALQIDIDFKVCDTEYSLIYYSGAYQLSIRDFFGFGHDLSLTIFNDKEG